MSKKHFFLYDFLLPLFTMLVIGQLLSEKFDTVIFQHVDRIKAFGLGHWFGQSSLRASLWNYSSLVFAGFPVLLWTIWIRINVEYDWVNHCRRLDRPVFSFVKNLVEWIEGKDTIRQLTMTYERQLQLSENRIQKLQAELVAIEAEFPEEVLEEDYRRDNRPSR